MQVSGLLQNKTPLMVGAAVIAALLIPAFWHSPDPPAKISSKNPPVQNKALTAEQVDAYVKDVKRRTEELDAETRQTKAIQDRQQAMASGVPTGQPVGYAPAPQAQHPEKDSNIALSFRAGGRSQMPAVPADTDIKKLIEEERTALAQNIHDAQLRTLQNSPYLPKKRDPEEEDEEKKPDPKAVPEELTRSVGKTYRLFEGSLIESVLQNRLNGSFTGPVDVLVTSPVYSHDAQHVLIPQGSRVVGEAQRVNAQGQQRLAVVFHRMIMPDGYSVNLDQFKGLNQIGETGLKDKIDHHYLQIFSTSIALGLVSGFSLVGTGGAYTAGGFSQYRQGVSSSIGTSSTRVLDQGLNILPTITIREGHRVRIMLRQDLELPALENHRIAGDI